LGKIKYYNPKKQVNPIRNFEMIQKLFEILKIVLSDLSFLVNDQDHKTKILHSN